MAHHRAVPHRASPSGCARRLLARADPQSEEDGLMARVQASIELCSARGRIQVIPSFYVLVQRVVTRPEVFRF